MRHKTNELEGALLDAAVARCLGRGVHDARFVATMQELFGRHPPLADFRPSERWEHGGRSSSGSGSDSRLALTAGWRALGMACQRTGRSPILTPSDRRP